MEMNKADLILHPARLQILRALAEKPMSTQDLAGQLDGVPKSSIYRHMRALVDGGLVEIAETRPVKGTLEKYYRLATTPHINQMDLAGRSPEEHFRYFAMFLASQLQGFSGYLNANPKMDYAADRVGYSFLEFYATPEEFDQLQAGMRTLFLEMVANAPAKGRRKQKMAIITHPLD